MTKLTQHGHFINGGVQLPSNREFFESVDPSSGEPHAVYARGSEMDVDDAVGSAQNSLVKWSRYTAAERGRSLQRLGMFLKNDAERFARLESIDCGHPIGLMRKDIDVCVRYLEYYGGAADKIHGETIPANNDHLTYTVHEPFGVTAQIIPWNAPLHQLLRGAAPSLAAGNSVVIKPAELTPATAIEFAKLSIEAGLPEGLINVVTGYGFEAGKAIVAHKGVKQLTFVGSVATGQAILTEAAKRILPVTAELGGKSPFIVFSDADLDLAVKAAVPALLTFSGQTCSAATRFLVQREAAPEFARRMVEIIKQTISLGPGLADCSMGPVISQEQMEKVLKYAEVGVSEGAQIAVGGTRANTPETKAGFFVNPTILVNVENSMRVAQEEIFGPVGVVIPFDTEEDAIHIANDSDFGLVAAVWTRDFAKGHRVAKAIECGQAFINNYRGVNHEAPFGGVKMSGLGREKGLEAIRSYTYVKTYIVKV